MVTRYLFPAIWIMFCAETALASPTSNEYLKCHRLAAASLMTCLDQEPGKAPKKCWSASERENRNCYRELRQDHQPNAARRAAAQEAAE